MTYRKQAAAIELANAKELLAATTKHDEALDKLQASLLRASELDEATAVRDERKRVAARPEVVGATKLVAATKAGTQPVVGVPSKNLLENPGFETPPSETERVPGWEMAVGKNWKRRNFDPSPQEGKQYFFAGPGAKAELRQTVSVESYRSKIDAGKQAFRFEGHVSSWKIAKDTSQIVVEFLDWQKEAILDVFDSGVKKSAMKWQKIQHEQVAPKGTRFIRVRLIAARNDGKNNDGYFDNISLVAIQG